MTLISKVLFFGGAVCLEVLLLAPGDVLLHL